MFIQIISGLIFSSLIHGGALSCPGSQENWPICPPQTSNETYFFPNPQNCSTYFICSNGCPIELNCPPGLNFDPELRTCRFPIDAQCTELAREQLYPFPCETGAVQPNPCDCASYLFCLGGGFADVMPCPPATNFNESLLVCDWIENVTCKQLINCA